MSSLSVQEYTTSKSSDDQHSIDDLCSFVRGLQGKATANKALLSVLDPEEKNYLISTTPIRTNAGTPPTILCVHDLLTDNNLTLSREDRMGLALRLSHAVLQFYSTPWIDENWTWRSFAFAKDGEDPDGNCDTTQLFVTRNFYSAKKMADDSDNSDSAAQVALPFRWAEPILTRLGFALIELALGARLADLRARNLPALKTLVPPNLSNAWMNAEILDRETSRLLVNSGVIRREEGQAYEDAVKACLDHQFIRQSVVRGVNSRSASFYEDVEYCILAPLYKMWEKSWGHI
ncbi:hypothetical protein N431DRAFT_438266 [Stipitochalara longipes BDJ]|nr:hypothetical protein N431DRAFT_438266 [Stipitochalara longipes BDJ]